jgi:hypothetical protein
MNPYDDYRYNAWERKLQEEPKVDDLERQRIRRQADETIARAQRTIERAERKIEQLEAFGDDVYDEETVLCFYKKFPNHASNHPYTYMAAKINGKWYLTGPQQSGLVYNWGGLIEFVVGNNALDDIEVWQALEWERIV